MKEDEVFQHIGKGTPYKVPEGFFDHVSENTLRKAKERERKRKKTRSLWYTVSVAASLAALVLISYRVMVADLEPKINTTVQNDTVGMPIIESSDTVQGVEPLFAEAQETVTEKMNEIVAQIQKEEENIEDILSDLTDEELVQLVSVFESDHFMDEATIE